MTTRRQLGDDRRTISQLVSYYRDHLELFEGLRGQLLASFNSDHELMDQVHSMRSRIKDPEHLRAKLAKKQAEARSGGRSFPITSKNLFTKITDLVGCRILHLYTGQFDKIHACLDRIFVEQKYEVLESACARTWDDESRSYFRGIGVRTVQSKQLYTSVHYIIAPNRRTKLAAEIQVRTLAEELWGEVDHILNYPQESPSLSCREQIKALARVTSGCTRLVDSLFRSHSDYVETQRLSNRGHRSRADAKSARKRV